ncbi:MAG: RsmD family RNA methyltransferase, partial [Thermoleophilia bacterium]
PLVDNGASAIATIHKNITKLKLENAHAARRDYLAFLKHAAKKQERFDLIFVDPPYRMHRVVEPELGRWLPRVAAPGGMVIVESDSREEVSLPLELVTEKVYGDTRIRIFRYSGQLVEQTADQHPPDIP